MTFGTLVAVLGHISPGPSGVCVGEIVSMIQYQIAVAKWMSERRISRANVTPSCRSRQPAPRAPSDVFIRSSTAR
jgi:hypothetical protein